jgi:uncharacterized membrane protein
LLVFPVPELCVRRFINYFIRGLLVVTPLAVTVGVCVWLFVTIDGLLGLQWPGAGFVVTMVLITVTGFLASTLVSRGAVTALDRLFDRVPFIRLLYGSTRDMLDAFVGEKRRFDKPVLVRLSSDGVTRVIGFLTSESLASIGAAGHVSVYVPQSYGFSGNIVVVPDTHVTRLDADAAEVMAFVISGGVTNVDRRPAPPPAELVAR